MQEKQALRYLDELGQAVERLVPDAEGKLGQRLEESRKIVEDERLLAWKGVQSAIDPDARLGWKSAKESFFGYKESVVMTEDDLVTSMKVEPGNASDCPAFEGLRIQAILTTIAVNAKRMVKLASVQTTG
ncbi:hypothetical protein [Paenibacillus sp. URB8-2]|uniref:hypothetical protein n=1 Tax=Paenibacillus sp. URB8-2 TaxID=2741301 RepID=UPI0015C200A0|nr:hypothetical protein [Paenibacillus sp. URB8-2]BCG57099.1 hypothetical protein PUR_05240 [Paenibacillus sp. URB8-2]